MKQDSILVGTQKNEPQNPGQKDTLLPPKSLRIFLAEDHNMVREGIKTLINAQPDMDVIGESVDGEEAWRRIRALVSCDIVPDVVVMDISMPNWNGTEATRRIKRSWPNVKVLALSMHEDRSYFRSIMEAGATGYILKRSAAAELIRAVRAVMSGSTYIDPNLTATLVDTFLRPANTRLLSDTLQGEIIIPPLSEREDSVLRLIAQGYTNKEIAVQLKLSVKTIETYKARSMEKLGMDSRTDIVRYALSKGWLT